MQTLGISESTPRSEGRAKSLLWPSIRSQADLDYVARQGFWICFVVGVVGLLLGIVAGAAAAAAFESIFFVLAGVGMRERDRFAGIAGFSAYLLSAIVLQKHTGNGFGVVRIIFLALLFSNIRGNWLAARWAPDESDVPPARMNETFGDKLVDQMPAFLWPKGKYVFYALAVIELGLLTIALFASRIDLV